MSSSESDLAASGVLAASQVSSLDLDKLHTFNSRTPGSVFRHAFDTPVFSICEKQTPDESELDKPCGKPDHK